MEITELYVYPLKGAAGIRLRQARLDAFGIEHDRRWMIVDDDGVFVTQRNEPALALVHASLEADSLDAGPLDAGCREAGSPNAASLVLRSEAAGELRVTPPSPDAVREHVRVWDEVVAAVDAGPAAREFVSAHLGRGARLFHMPVTTHRQVALEHAREGDRVSFADGFPLLLITRESLDALNRRLPAPVPMNRFRPNVVVAGASPHAEDTWRTILLGTVACDVVKPCARCAVTTVDQRTGTAGAEPLRTLAGYRRWDGRTWFGQNVIHRGEGVLSVGDSVVVTVAGDARPPLAPVVA
jgi:uncharacterized protein